jgi:uncharacterized protein YqjF (DUF2071 family)
MRTEIDGLPTHHRDEPPPVQPFVMHQTWRDLLFAHWPVPVSALRGLVPAGLSIDAFNGMAWVGVVPFRMTGVRPRGIPSVPWLSSFPELNVRTYVKAGDKPGVWFFSLDAANPLAVISARAVFHLPYYHAHMACRSLGTTVDYRSERTHPGAPPAQFSATYQPNGDVYFSRRGTLEHWLTERYRLYAADRAGRLYRAEIHHRQWPLQAATATITVNTMAQAAGIALPDMPPLLHFARRLDMVAWMVEGIDT